MQYTPTYIIKVLPRVTEYCYLKQQLKGGNQDDESEDNNKQLQQEHCNI